MAKEPIQLGEGFSANVVKATAPIEVKPRHRVIGYGAILALLSAMGYFIAGHGPAKVPVMQEKPGIIESLGTKIGGKVSIDHVRAGTIIGHWDFPNQVINAGETMLRDCFNNNTGTACTTVANFEFHGLGTSSAAIAETDTGCTTELTTQYAVDNTRPTGSQTTNGANVYRTVGTNTVDGAVTVNEFCLMSAASGGTMWTRILTGAVALSSGDSLVTTYDLTIE